MSDKLKLLNKILFLLILIYSSSCSFFVEKINTNTEIICPNGSAILIKFIRAKDLRQAINTAFLNKKRLKTSENYTPVRLKDGRSFVLKNMPPELAASCSLRESIVGQVEDTYIHHF